MSPKNLFVEPFCSISKVIVPPSISNAVIEPAEASAPPMMLPLPPTCSISKLDVAPTGL